MYVHNSIMYGRKGRVEWGNVDYRDAFASKIVRIEKGKKMF